MINAKKLYSEDKNDWYDYQPIIDAFGTVALQIDDEDYQGDSRILYECDGKIGYLQFGWGSCSGCDALQACNTIEEVQELIQQLESEIKWFDDKREALVFFKNHDWEGDYSYCYPEQKTFVDQVIELLKLG
jgi:hypothetical protein